MDEAPLNSEIIKKRLIENSIPIPESGCWIWLKQANIHGGGYGRISINNKVEKAHRVSYRIFIGEIPDKLFVCHHCDTPSCINPYHLFIGTNLDNQKDMHKKGRFISGHAKKQYCRNGHPYSNENTIYYKKGKTLRACRICRNKAKSKYHTKLRAIYGKIKNVSLER